MLNRLLGPVTQIENSHYVFLCSTSSGTAPMTFNWKFNNQALANNRDFAIESNDQFSFLKLSQVKRIHSGNYSCIVSNFDGVDSTHVELLVKGNLVVSANLVKVCRYCSQNGSRQFLCSWLYAEIIICLFYAFLSTCLT